MAKPLFGTTATQAACLFQAWGADKASDFYRKLHANDVQLVRGQQAGRRRRRRGAVRRRPDRHRRRHGRDRGGPTRSSMIFPDRDARRTASAASCSSPTRSR